jgi:large subunit ribosomal protein L7/L12
MAKLTTENFIEEIKGMTVLELNELVKAIEEEFGVSAAAPVAVAGAAVAEEEGVAGTVDVVLTAAGASKLAVIKVIRSVNAELGLKEAKEVADNGGVVRAGLDAEEGAAIKAQLEEAGASVELK